MRSALLTRNMWSPLAALLLFALLVAPSWAQEDKNEGDAAQNEAAPMAAADEEAPEITEEEMERQHAKADPELPSDGAHAPEDMEHNPHDLSHNDGSAMIAAPHEANLDLAAFTLIVFIVLVVVLGLFAWTPILAGLKARESSMEGKMKKAEEMYEQANAKLAEYTRKLSESQQEIKQMRDDMVKAADEKAKQIVEAAEKSASATLDRATREIDAAKGAAINELAQASVNLAVDLAGQITRKELKAEDHANLIQDSISKLPSNN
ncbi:hypothetical protein [Bremerella cremea]|uniref:F0F1 ATP synthase subunit B family protein n=1 Tax=Bremerella cremea TaxID=1031537 RepID=UPI0031EC0878